MDEISFSVIRAGAIKPVSSRDISVGCVYTRCEEVIG